MIRPPSPRIQRWKSTLLWSVLFLFAYLTATGFALFFARRWIAPNGFTALSHTIAGMLGFVPYAIYQRAHYRRVSGLRTVLHYRLGLCAFWSFFVSLASGTYLVVHPQNVQIDLLHLMSSFAFLIFLAAHLVLVARLALFSHAQAG